MSSPETPGRDAEAAFTGLRSARAAIVTIGDELVLGETVDTNGAWLARELASLGFEVARQTSVGDDPQGIAAALREGLAMSDLVVLTGGLGPTPDDLTRSVVAETLGLELRLDPAVLHGLERRFRKRGIDPMPASNRSQAEVPEGAKVLPNPHGTAPGLAIGSDDGVVILLPGVPREMRALFQDPVREVLNGRFGRLDPVHHRIIRTTGCPESELTERIALRLPAGCEPVRIAFLPELTGVDLRLTVTGVTAEEAAAHFDEVELQIADALRGIRYHAPSGDLAEAVVGALRSRGSTVAVAESCTGGLVAKRLTDITGASAVVLGGVVAYADQVKRSLLGVTPESLGAHGAVSDEVAREMAHGVREALGAEVGVSVTGIAGPGGGSAEKPVGLVWMAVSHADEMVSRRYSFPGDRAAVRERAAQAALALLLRSLGGGG